MTVHSQTDATQSSSADSRIAFGCEIQAIGMCVGKDGRKWVQWTHGYSQFDDADFSDNFELIELLVAKILFHIYLGYTELPE